MKTITPRIEKAIDIFLDAINNGTLAKGNCTACAIGNLCAAGIDYKITVPLPSYNTNNAIWSRLFMTTDLGEQIIRDKYFSRDMIDEAMDLISKTGFSKEELMKIEYAFETNTKINYERYFKHSKEQIRADQIKGLEAVVKVMLTFDDCKETAQEVFTKRAELIPV